MQTSPTRKISRLLLAIVIGLALSLFNPGIANADEESDAIVENVLDSLEIDEIDEDLSDELGSLVEDSVDLGVIDEDSADAITDGDPETDPIVDNVAEQLANWEIVGPIWEESYAAVSDVFTQCRVEENQTCIEILGAQMTLNMAAVITEDGFEETLPIGLKNQFRAGLTAYYAQLDALIAEANARIASADLTTADFETELRVAIAALTEKALETQAKLEKREVRIRELASKADERAADKAQKTAERESKRNNREEEKKEETANRISDKPSKNTSKPSNDKAQKSDNKGKGTDRK